MTTIEDEIEILEIMFEKEIVAATPADLLDFGRGLGVGVQETMRKTQLLKMIRQHKDVSWGETPQENKAYLEKLSDAWKQLYTKKVSDKVETQEAEQLEVKGDTTGLTQLLRHLTTPG